MHIMSNRKKKKEIEYSKLILRWLISIQTLIVVSSIGLMIYVQDVTPLEWLIPSMSAELSISIGFYYNKAKRENELKIRKACREIGIEYNEENDNE